MAKWEITGMEDTLGKLQRLQGGEMRKIVKRIVMAGAEAEIKTMMDQTRSAGHVSRKAQMIEAVGAGDYHESIGGGEVAVYPQGTDDKGVRNAMKAFVINYGRGGRRSERMGDKFITGNKPSKQAEAIAAAAMQAEAEKILMEMGIIE